MSKVFSKLQDFPIDSFVIVMGLGGFCMTYLQVEAHPATASFNIKIADFVAWLSLMIFIILLTLFILKAIKYPTHILQEFNNHLTSGFFAAIPVCMLILSAGCFFEINTKFSEYLCIVGATLEFVVVVVMVKRWIYSTDIDINHITPVWFIPVVGCILVPVTGMQFGSLAFSWLFFSVGVLFWLVLFILLMKILILLKCTG